MTSEFSTDPARTRVLAERWASWVLPHWLERQADPASPAFAPARPVGGVVNQVDRGRVPVGVLDGSASATVDPRGLVVLDGGRWALDWWVGADDRWHLPSREPAVRQTLVGASPVVETAMRVPGGDVVERVWAFHDATSGETLAVELHNAGRVPVAVAVAVRPYGPDGAGRIDRIEVVDQQVRVDGRLAAWLPKPPARLAFGSLAIGDAAAVTTAGEATEAPSGEVECAAGFATAVVVYPLAHGSSLRLLVPAVDDGRVGRARSAPAVVPPHDAVARGWSTHLAQGARVELPDPELAEALTAAGAQLLLAAAGRGLTGDTSTTETAAVVGALDRLGFDDPAARIVATLPAGQGSGGRLGGADPASDATSAALVAAGRHWRVTRDDTLVAEIAGPLAAGGHHHLRGAGPFAGRRRSSPDSLVDLGWRLRGLLDAEASLSGTQPDAAKALARLAADVRATLDESLHQVVAVDALLLDTLTLVAPLEVLDPSHHVVDDLLDWAHRHVDLEGGVAQLVGVTGMSAWLTSLVGRCEARRGDVRAHDRVGWFVRHGGATRTWSDVVHPRLGTGCGGAGASVGAAAAFVELVLDLVVHERPDGTGLVLCPVWPESWLGAPLEVHGLRTTFGTVSFAIRWHGERPALLWELEPHRGVDHAVLTIPGLDPSWQSTDRRGDALLAVPTLTPPVEPEPADPAPAVTPVELGRSEPPADDSFS